MICTDTFSGNRYLFYLAWHFVQTKKSAINIALKFAGGAFQKTL